MKPFNLCILTSLVLFSMAAKGQIIETLAVNNINAHASAYGELFRSSNNNPGFEVPKGTGNHTIFSNGPWLGGKAQDETLHVASGTYSFTDSGEIASDFSAGPIATDYSASYDSIYERVWKVSRDMVANHKNQYDDPGYTMPEVIENWPAYQRPSMGIDRHPAPFVDANNNGAYDPENGDYPKIRGDKALYLIINDSRTPQSETGGNKFNIEIQTMVYAYEGTNDPALANAVFVNYNIVNVSGLNYKDVYLGNLTDFDIGFAYDDYVGCDTQRHLYFGYNGRDRDDDYNGLPPAMGGTFLSTPLNSFVYYQNNYRNQGNPEEPQHYYNYLQGKWRDGAPMTEGGDGYGLGSDTTRYLFYGNPNTPGDWSEESVGSTPNDRRAIGIAGPFSLEDKESICLDMAFIFARDSTQNDPDSRLKSVTKLENRRDKVSQFYENQDFDCPAIETYPMHTGPIKQANKPIELYPNPTSETIQLDLPFSQDQVKQITIFNTKGQKVVSEGNLKNERLSVGALGTGVYILQLRTSDQVYRHKLIKR